MPDFLDIDRILSSFVGIKRSDNNFRSELKGLRTLNISDTEGHKKDSSSKKNIAKVNNVDSKLVRSLDVQGEKNGIIEDNDLSSSSRKEGTNTKIDLDQELVRNSRSNNKEQMVSIDRKAEKVSLENSEFIYPSISLRESSLKVNTKQEAYEDTIKSSANSKKKYPKTKACNKISSWIDDLKHNKHNNTDEAILATWEFEGIKIPRVNRSGTLHASDLGKNVNNRATQYHRFTKNSVSHLGLHENRNPLEHKDDSFIDLKYKIENYNTKFNFRSRESYPSYDNLESDKKRSILSEIIGVSKKLTNILDRVNLVYRLLSIKDSVIPAQDTYSEQYVSGKDIALEGGGNLDTGNITDSYIIPGLGISKDTESSDILDTEDITSYKVEEVVEESLDEIDSQELAEIKEEHNIEDTVKSKEDQIKSDYDNLKSIVSNADKDLNHLQKDYKDIRTLNVHKNIVTPEKEDLDENNISIEEEMKGSDDFLSVQDKQNIEEDISNKLRLKEVVKSDASLMSPLRLARHMLKQSNSTIYEKSNSVDIDKEFVTLDRTEKELNDDSESKKNHTEDTESLLYLTKDNNEKNVEDGKDEDIYTSNSTSSIKSSNVWKMDGLGNVSLPSLNRKCRSEAKRRSISTENEIWNLGRTSLKASFKHNIK